MTITPNQLRAARSLINIAQDELAAKTGVSVTSLRQFELGNTGKLQQKTEAALLAFFAPMVEFIGERGVALRQEHVLVLEGDDAFARLLADMESHLREKSDKEALFLSLAPDLDTPATGLLWDKLQTAGVRCRHIGSGEQPTPISEHRHLDRMSPDATQIVYGETVVQQIAPAQFLVVRSPMLASALRQTFEALWHTRPALAVVGDEGESKSVAPVSGRLRRTAKSR